MKRIWHRVKAAFLWVFADVRTEMRRQPPPPPAEKGGEDDPD